MTSSSLDDNILNLQLRLLSPCLQRPFTQITKPWGGSQDLNPSLSDSRVCALSASSRQLAWSLYLFGGGNGGGGDLEEECKLGFPPGTVTGLLSLPRDLNPWASVSSSEKWE